MLVPIFILSFFTVFLTALILLGYEAPSRVRAKQSLEQIDEYLATGKELPPDPMGSIFSRGILSLAIEKLARRVSKLSLVNNENLQLRLAKAGIRSADADKFLSIKFMLVGAGLLVNLLFIMTWLTKGGHMSWIGWLAIVPLYFGPDYLLKKRAEARQKQIRLSLPNSLEILTIALEAGASFDSALVKVVKNMKGPLGEEFARMLWEWQVGISRHDALRHLGDRNDVPELKRITSLLIQADTLGISISKLLRVEVAEIRKKRKQLIEEAAQKTTVKLVFPVILFIIPALMLIIMGPGLIRIAQVFTNN